MSHSTNCKYKGNQGFPEDVKGTVAFENSQIVVQMSGRSHRYSGLTGRRSSVTSKEMKDFQRQLLSCHHHLVRS